jgi:hypothetical protein
MTSEQSTKPRRGRPSNKAGGLDHIGARYWTAKADADGPDLPMPDLSEPRVLTEQEALAMVFGYCRRPSSRTGSGRVSLQVAYETSSILRSQYFFKLIVSGERGDALVRSAVSATKEAPRSYTLHYLPNVFLRFCKYYDLISAKQYKSWREKLPRYSPASKAADLVLDPEELRTYFNYLSDRCSEQPHNYFRWREYFAASLGLLTGCREGQVLRLQWPYDVEVSPNSITFYFQRQKSARKAPQVHHISPATALPSGEPFSYVFDNLISVLPPGSQGLYVGSGTPPQRPAHISLSDTEGILGRKVTMRSLRATAASIVANMVGVFQAKEMLGHTSIQTTMNYVNALPLNQTSKMSEAISSYSTQSWGE